MKRRDFCKGVGFLCQRNAKSTMNRREMIAGIGACYIAGKSPEFYSWLLPDKLYYQEHRTGYTYLRGSYFRNAQSPGLIQWYKKWNGQIYVKTVVFDIKEKA